MMLSEPHFLTLAAALLGLIVGSFLNVVIHRLPRMMERGWMLECAELRGETPPSAEKLTLARQLERLGVDVIEAGFPIASDGDFESVRAIAQEIRGATICGLARTGPRRIFWLPRTRCFSGVASRTSSRPS